MYRELMIGAGSDHRRRLSRIPTLDNPPFQNLTTLDLNGDHNPDIVWDLNDRPLPFDDNTFDEIHAYEVLEHIGRQGDFKAFFEEFEEYWRILKPKGFLYATCPCWNSMWAWGDPSHTRVISPGTLVFLSQKEYDSQIGKTAMSDFRYIYKGDFQTIYKNDCERSGTFIFILEAIK